MKKVLYFYWYVPSFTWCNVYDEHIHNLSIYKDVFDECNFIISVDDDTTESAITFTKEKIKNAVPNASFSMFQNDKEFRGEVSYFYKDIILKFGEFDKDTAIFFAHAKGAHTNYVTPWDLYTWINAMYYFNLSDENKIDKLLADEDTCVIGTGKIINYAPPGFVPYCKYRWHYSGTFFWMVPNRIDKYIKKNNIEILPIQCRHYSEGFWGSIFPDDAKECKCIGEYKAEHETWVDYVCRNLNDETVGDYVKKCGPIPLFGSNIDIFVFAHKTFETERINPVYKIVCSNDCDVKSDKLGVIRLDCEISNIGFSEWQKIYEIYTKRRTMLKDYVGLAHYHRFLSFSDNVNYVPSAQEFNDIFSNFDILIKHPLMVGNLRAQYGECHNIKDYDIMMDIIKTDFPDWAEVAEDCTKSGLMFDSNIMILRKNDFIGLCDFVFPVLFKYCERVGIDRTSDDSFIKYVNDRSEEYSKVHKPNDKFNEQARICSYLAERLVIMYISRYLNRVMILKMVEK